MSQKQRLFSIFSLGFVSLLVFALTFSACNNSTSPKNPNPVDPDAQTPVAEDFMLENLTQTAGKVVAVSITPKPGKSGGKVTIYYNKLTTLPTDVGEYPVTFNVAKASGWNAAKGLSAGTLTINATDQEPTADDFEFGNLVQTAGNVIPVSITPLMGKSAGDVTIYYDGSTTLPTAVGTYAVTFDVAAAVGFNAAPGLSAGTLTITNQIPVAEDYIFGNLTQTAGAIIPVSITPRPGKSGGDVTAIYYNGSTTLPAETGTYLITFDIEAVEGFDAAVRLVAGTLTINATDQDPAAGDFDIGNLTQTEGSVIPVTITPLSGKSGGAITVHYNGSTALPTAAGSYTVTFNVAAAVGFKAADGLPAGTLTINAAVPVNVKYKIYSNGTLDSNYSLSDWSAVKTTNLESTEGGHSGDKAIKLPNTGDRYLSIRAKNASTVNWSTVDALSFWVKGDNIRVSAFGFLDDAVSGKDTLNVEYKGEDGAGITVGNTWQQILIPLPNSAAKGAAVSRREVFKLWITGQDNKTLYIDDIELVSTSKNFAIVIPETKSIDAGTVTIASLLGNYKAEYTVSGKKVSLFSDTVKFANWFDITYNVGSGAARNGDNITAAGNFTLTVGFGGNTSNHLTATVAQPPAPPPANNVKYKIYSDGTLTSGYTITNWANADAFQLASTAGGGRSGTKAMRLPDTGANNWGRGLSIRAASASAINWSTVDALSFWVKGDNVRVNSFGLLDDAGSGGDSMNVEYKGENGQGVTLTNTWQNILIPLPNNTAKGAAISRTEVFKIYITNATDQDNKAVYIDDIELISAAKNFTIAIPTSATVPAGTNAIATLLGNYKAEYTVDGKKVSLFSNTVKFANWFDITYNVSSGAVRNGENLNVTGNFTLSAAFGGKTSNTLNATAQTNVVLYSQHGAKGDGVTDDFGAIIAAHAAANASGAMVRAEAGKTYYIGGGTRTASIKTNTDWTGAKFIIDDTKVTKGNGTAWNDSWIFLVESAQSGQTKTSSVTSLTKNQAKVNNLNLSSAAVIVAYDNTTKRYIRRGENANSGADQTDVFIVDQNGNVDTSAPIIWNFTRITNLVAYPIDAQTLTITGGEFTTKANTGNADDNYMKRGIRIVRSNTVIDGLKHLIEGEGSQAAPYDAFLKFENCANVTVQNTTLTGHRGYPRPSQPQTTRGTYDINAARTVNLSFINCRQTNSITNGTYWGIFASNYSKNILLDNVEFSRFDAHQGVRNVSILNSKLGHQGVSTIGSGLLRIENTTVYGSNFIYFRDDYGSTWEGELRIINCTFQPPTASLNGNYAQIIHTNNDGKWNFGYDCYMPETITINGFTVVETGVTSSYNGVLLVSAVNTNTSTEPYPFRLTKTINLSGYNSSKNYRMSNSYITNQIRVNRN